MQIVVTDRVVDQLKAGIKALAPHANILVVDEDGLGADPSTAEVLVAWRLSAKGLQRVVAAAPQLRWIHTASAGVDHIISPQLRQRELTLTNSSGVHAVPIAEWVLAAILAGAKRLRELQDAQRERRWLHNELHLAELTGKVLLILGLGDIGRAVARRAAAFDMRVWGTRRRQEPVHGVERVLGPHDWRAALPDADYLVVCLPLTGETRHLLGAGEFRMMKPTAWLVNIARGDIVDEHALVEALHAGRPGGAALDVFEKEPLPVDSPLWTMDQVLVSPHLSWSSPYVGDRAAELFLENFARYCSGQELKNQVSLDAGY